MKCPFCSFTESKVLDSRPADDNERIRRRRECIKCEKRFTTNEVIENVPIMVMKKDNVWEPFNRQKLITGLMRACQKRPVTPQRLEEVVDTIEQTILNSFSKEVTTEAIGEMMMNELKMLDEVAYIRFASVYRQFSDISSFMKELEELSKKD